MHIGRDAPAGTPPILTPVSDDDNRSASCRKEELRFHTESGGWLAERLAALFSLLTERANVPTIHPASLSCPLEREAEACTAAGRALDVHRASVRFDEAAGYGEPEPGGGRAVLPGTGPRPFAAERAFEDAR